MDELTDDRNVPRKNRTSSSASHFLFRGLMMSMCLLGTLPLVAFAGPSVQGEGQPDAIVHLSRSRNQILVPVTVNGIKTNFLLDTGSDGSYLFPEFLDKLHADASETVVVDQFELGSVKEGSQAFEVADLPGDFASPEDLKSGRVAGILGLDQLMKWNVGLDIHRLQLALWSPAHYGDAAKNWWFRDSKVSSSELNGPSTGPFTSPTTVGDQDVWAVYDTGSESSGYDASLLQNNPRLRWKTSTDLSYASLGDRSGDIYQTSFFYLNGIKLNGSTLLDSTENLREDLGTNGLIGVPELEKLKLLWEFSDRQLLLTTERL